MPIYDYACTVCGRVVEVVHGVNGQGPEACATCGGALRKLLSTPALHFKGSGWAKKDRHASSQTKAAARSGTNTDSSGTDASSPDRSSNDDSSAGTSSTDTSTTDHSRGDRSDTDRSATDRSSPDGSTGSSRSNASKPGARTSETPRAVSTVGDDRT